MRPLDVRVMASTHVDLAVEAQEGRFPVGLYECLTACSIHVPPVRERLQDIGLLTEHILNHLAVVEGKPVKRLSVEALKTLRSHDWPGNLRELENVDRAGLFAGRNVVADGRDDRALDRPDSSRPNRRSRRAFRCGKWNAS